jgi:glycosyltransferase involved in cell wall biosynthesis
MPNKPTKTAIFIAHYNKNITLSNVLYSLNQQQTSFPLELCFVDDNSVVDPEMLLKKYLVDVKFKYLRSKQNVSTRRSMVLCLDLVDDATDYIILMSSEVVLLQKNIIEEMCNAIAESTESRTFSMVEVKNIALNPAMHLNFKAESENLLASWERYSGGSNIYSGSRRPGGHYIFFLGAITRANLPFMKFGPIYCDKIAHLELYKNNFKPIYLDHLKGVHQAHLSVLHPCDVVDDCQYASLKCGGTDQITCQQRFRRFREK